MLKPPSSVPKTKPDATDSDPTKERSHDNVWDIDSGMTKALLDIEHDIEHLRQIKDIIDELGIIRNIFHTQQEVLVEMNRMIREPKTPPNVASGTGDDEDKDSSDDSIPLRIVKRNIGEVKRLDGSAQRAASGVWIHQSPTAGQGG